MKTNLTTLALLGVLLAASGVAISACSGGDDDDDDDDGGGGQPVVSQADGGPADFTACVATSAGSMINTVIEVGKQPADPEADPTAFAGASVVLYDPATGTTSGTAVVSDGSGLANISVPKNAILTFKVTHAPDPGPVTYVPTFNYGEVSPAADDVAGDPTFEVRSIPSGVRDLIKGLLTNTATDITGKFNFAGAVEDCAGETIVGATITLNGAVLPSCLGPGGTVSTLPCVSYSTDVSEDYTDDGGQVFVIGMLGTGTAEIAVHAILSEGGALTEVGSLTVRGVADGIGVGVIPPADAP